MFIAAAADALLERERRAGDDPSRAGVVLFDHEHGVASACGILHKAAQAGGASVEFIAISLARVVDGSRHAGAADGCGVARRRGSLSFLYRSLM